MKSFAEILAQHPKPLPTGGQLNPTSFTFTPQGASVVKETSAYKGRPIVFFTDEDVQVLSSPFKFVLVGKFSKGHSNMEDLCKDFQMVGFKGVYSIGLLDS